MEFAATPSASTSENDHYNVYYGVAPLHLQSYILEFSKASGEECLVAKVLQCTVHQ